MKVAENLRELRNEGEQKGGKLVAAFCDKLLLFSGLGRLRQDLVNLVSRFVARRSIQLSYGRVS